MEIKGKEYMLVNERVKLFREKYPYGDIQTKIISLENGVVVIQADIYQTKLQIIEGGERFEPIVTHLASGIAYEKENSTFINKTSYIENCETSAVGRALGFLGIGIDTSIASAEEVGNAVVQQESMQPINATQVKALQTYLKNKGFTQAEYQQLLENYNVNDLKELTIDQFNSIIKESK